MQQVCNKPYFCKVYYIQFLLKLCQKSVYLTPSSFIFLNWTYTSGTLQTDCTDCNGCSKLLLIKAHLSISVCICIHAGTHATTDACVRFFQSAFNLRQWWNADVIVQMWQPANGNISFPAYQTFFNCADMSAEVSGKSPSFLFFCIWRATLLNLCNPLSTRKSYEFEDLLQSSSDSCRVDWYAQSRLGLTRTLSEENVYEDIIGKQNYTDSQKRLGCCVKQKTDDNVFGSIFVNIHLF